MDSKFLSSKRRFGIEIEVNSPSGRNYKINPLQEQELPDGIEEVGCTILKALPGVRVEITTWGRTAHNKNWIIKPDSSCGIEICSPVLKGDVGIEQICSVVDAIKEDKNIKVDDQCSFHLTVEVADSSNLVAATILAYWVKCEATFLDLVPEHRKHNRYCTAIGATDMFSHDIMPSPAFLIEKLGHNKYYTANCFNLRRTSELAPESKKRTLEFRVIGHEGCRDSSLVRNWIKLIIHFIEIVKDMPYPKSYVSGDEWSSLLWLEPKSICNMLGFCMPDLDNNLVETREWFLQNIYKNTESYRSPEFFNPSTRLFARQQVKEMMEQYNVKFLPNS